MKFKIEHVAIWVKDLEMMRKFYEKFFYMKSDVKYINEKKGFFSYFLSLEGGGARLELMQSKYLEKGSENNGFIKGLTHLAISVGSKESVDDLTAKLREGGFVVESEPRTTGDGYYESVILDPEDNRVEITV